jgi:poly(A) polymerase
VTDLNARRLRFIEDASRRIQEDFLRSLRFFRFYAIYSDPEVGFDPTALAAIAANLEGLASLSVERVGSEIKKLLAAPDPAPALAGMRATGVLQQLLPAADDRALAPLVHLETAQGVRADPIRRLAALTTGQEVIAALRLSKVEARQHEQIGAALGNMQGPAELAYRGGAAFALDVLLLRAALFETRFDATSHTQIVRGAAAVCPVKSADFLPLVQGAALGQALRDCEARWIASDFQLTRAALLTSAV